MKSAGYGWIVATSSMGAQGASEYGSLHRLEMGRHRPGQGMFVKWLTMGITVNAICPAAVGTDLFFNQAMYDLFCPDVERPRSKDFEEPLKSAQLLDGTVGRTLTLSTSVAR
jgi:NAD(P)-dependent dehydrogenase (short-subunit alcohol dehydrogenase family)